MIRLYHIQNISWNLDSEEPEEEFDEEVIPPSSLPSDCYLELRHIPDEDVEDCLSDELSNEYGYCHNGFTFTEVTYIKCGVNVDWTKGHNCLPKFEIYYIPSDIPSYNEQLKYIKEHLENLHNWTIEGLGFTTE